VPQAFAESAQAPRRGDLQEHRDVHAQILERELRRRDIYEAKRLPRITRRDYEGLQEEEVYKLIEGTEDLRDRAIIEVLWKARWNPKGTNGECGTSKYGTAGNWRPKKRSLLAVVSAICL